MLEEKRRESVEMPSCHLAVYQEATVATTELYAAAARGASKEVDEWLKKGGCANWYNERAGGLTAVHAAAEQDEQTLATLLAFKSETEALIARVDLLSTGNKGQPLHFAASAGNAGCVRLLLKHNALVDARNAYGNTPLMLACAGLRYDAAKALLDHGADPKAQTFKGETPLHCAIAGVMACSRQQEGCDMRLIKLLLAEGADLNAQDENGSTALHVIVCIRENDTLLRLVEVLLKNGANPKIKDNKGKRPSDIMQLRPGGTELLTTLQSHEFLIF